MKPTYLIVQRADEGKTLQNYLSDRLKLSRRKAKGLIDSRTIQINGARVWMAHHNVQAGDRLTLPLPRIDAPQAVPILFKDERCLVVNKSPGMLSNGNSSVESVLRRQPGLADCRAVHRLDRDTSGCLLFVIKEKDLLPFINLFREHAIAKQYRAIVKGMLPYDRRTITTALETKRAITRLQILDTNEEASHISVSIETGRTHQIRKHLASIGHPVLGDVEYAASNPSRHSSPAPSTRQMLHAAEIRLPNPFVEGGQIHAKAPLPQDFVQTLHRLKLR